MTQTKAELLQTRHQGDIRLGDADSSHYVGFKAPATVGSSLVWTLPAADGTANYLLKTDGSGNLGWVADSTTDSTKMPLAGGTFTGDVTFSGDANNVVWDKSDNALEFADNAVLRLGSDADLDILHTGANGLIKNTTGTLYIQDDSAVIIGSVTNSHSYVKGVYNGAVELFHNNVKKGETTADGWSVTGLLTASGNIQINNDTSQIRLGASQDLRIYHNGSASYIEDVGPGNLFIRAADNVSIQSYNGSENMATFIENGAVELYHNNVKKIETTAQAVKITGGIAQVVTAAGALDLDLNTSNYFTKTISGNSTFTFSNPAASGQATAFTLELTHSSGTVTWPSSVKWNADTAPTLTTGKTHLFMFVTDDGGSRYRGSALVDYVN